MHSVTSLNGNTMKQTNSKSSNGDSLRNYADEPANYTEVRSEIFKLMVDLKKCKDQYEKLANMEIFREMHQEDVINNRGNLCQVIWFLGELYGYTLSDDVLSVENFVGNGSV